MSNHEFMSAYFNWSRNDDSWKKDEMHHYYDQPAGNNGTCALQRELQFEGQGARANLADPEQAVRVEAFFQQQVANLVETGGMFNLGFIASRMFQQDQTHMIAVEVIKGQNPPLIVVHQSWQDEFHWDQWLSPQKQIKEQFAQLKADYGAGRPIVAQGFRVVDFMRRMREATGAAFWTQDVTVMVILAIKRKAN